MKNAFKGRLWLVLILALIPVFAFGQDTDKKDNKKVTPVPAADQWDLVWNDEFDGEGLPDPKKWTFEVQKPGWVNNELQYYTKRTENCRQEKGFLIIEALMDNFEGCKYTSARIRTQYKGDYTYGKFVIRAKLPPGKGTWGAIWALPTNARSYGVGWPSSGEIDIMECVGYKPNVVQTSIHSGKYNWKNHNEKSAKKTIDDMYDKFHEYTMYWYEDRLEIAVDNEVYLVFPNEKAGWISWPFDKRFYVILNLAIGGDWGAAEGMDDTIFPTRMVIDYVRIYQLKQKPATTDAAPADTKATTP
jgi:beta-glucanase (GH16 family)